MVVKETQVNPGMQTYGAQTFFTNLSHVLRQNIREYGMFIALFVIMAIFGAITPNNAFISPRNISNLLNQAGYIAILAVGMTLVIIIRHIDLSVGFLAGFLGAVAAVALTAWGWSVWIVIPFVLVLGAIAGLATAFPVAQLKIPSFVASLAGWLIYRGALVLTLQRTGTIIIPDRVPAFKAIGSGFVPDIPTPESWLQSENFLLSTLADVHIVTLLIGLVAIAWFIFSSMDSRRKKKAYGFEVLPRDMFVLQMVFVSVLIGYVSWVLAGYNGLSWTVVIVIVVVVIYQFLMSRTVLGRHIYAIGGNPEAAELSGISVKRLTFFVFGSMGMLAALSGILFTARLNSATPTAGELFELEAISAAYVGGVSAAGGVGRVTGSIIGALVMMSLINGMNLMGTDNSWASIIRGLVLVAAVVFDVATRKGRS